jgi:16S rRNA (guanine527-N7)-methyltransferase
LLKPQGQLIALKGRSAQEEIEKGASAIAKNKGLHPRVLDAEVAPGMESTHVVIVDKR